ncbi:MAG: type II secretion system protein M [Gammaproteobacteria bacterium]|nr:type II secretion system protein M [Gammaproteobacteria bacterium]
MKDWFGSLDPRERRILIAGAVVLLAAMLYLLVWEPFMKKTAELEQSNRENQELLTWMEQSAEEAKKLQAKLKINGPTGGDKGQSLLGTIDRTAKTANLGKSVKRVQPDGQSKARVWLENAPFNDTVKWLENLQRQQGIHIVTSVVEKQEESGLVNVRLVLEGLAE